MVLPFGIQLAHEARPEINVLTLGPKEDQRVAVITGAAGFIGGYCAREFNRNGWRVVGIDRESLSSGSELPKYLCHYELDNLADSDRLSAVFEKVAPSVIIHAAGPANVGRSFREPAIDFRDHVAPWSVVLEGIRRAALDVVVVLCSSAAVYGSPPDLPIRESTRVQPISPYGYHKLIKELLLQEYVSVFKVRGTAARIFSTFGPGLRQLAVWEITKRLMCGDFRLEGTGLETRDYLYIEDVAAALYCIGQSGPHGGEPINVASGLETEIGQLAGCLARECGYSDVEFAYESRPGIGKPSRWCADVTLLSRTGFVPIHSFGTALSQTVKWIRAQ